MSASTSKSRTSTWVGIAVGIVLLGLLAAFAIGLPKAHGDAGESAPALDLSLPDTLPGGYAAADDPASFADGELAQQADQIAQQQAASTKYGNDVLPDVLGNPAATRSYVVDGTKAVFVQVFEAQGGAFAPTVLTDPSTTNGGGGTTMEQVGDGVCILTYGQSQGGTPAAPTTPAASQCQVTHDRLTVQIQSTTVPADELVKVAGTLADDLQD
ncbi:MAG TPA: hypothetical protein VFT70_10735 [Nocardioides sp.]|nr:hypothetical protein [Nocardioides sp.]